MSAHHALITGASGGIGKSLADLFAKANLPVILVARDKTALKKVATDLAQKYGVATHIIPADLSTEVGVQAVIAYTEKHKLDVQFLINNAGFGDRVDVTSADTQRLKNMIRLNDEALVVLSQYYAQKMVHRGSGSICNIASIAAFLPGPGMAVYYASKAFVLSFSQALAQELARKNVSVTVVCPGPTKTGFADAANASKSKIFSGNLPSADDVACFTYNAIRAKKRLAIWGTRNQLIARFSTLAPRDKLAASVQKLQ